MRKKTTAGDGAIYLISPSHPARAVPTEPFNPPSRFPASCSLPLALKFRLQNSHSSRNKRRETVGERCALCCAIPSLMVQSHNRVCFYFFLRTVPHLHSLRLQLPIGGDFAANFLLRPSRIWTPSMYLVQASRQSPSRSSLVGQKMVCIFTKKSRISGFFLMYEIKSNFISISSLSVYFRADSQLSARWYTHLILTNWIWPGKLFPFKWLLDGSLVIA